MVSETKRTTATERKDCDGCGWPIQPGHEVETLIVDGKEISNYCSTCRPGKSEDRR